MIELMISHMQPTFIPNAGQVGQKIHYYVKGAGYGINFMEDGVVFAFLEPFAKTSEQQTVKGYAVTLRFLGANNGVKPEGRQEASGKVNYLNGIDLAKWKTDLPTYEEIVYRELWPHVDMVFREGNGRVKYEFVVQPGARIEDIQLTYRGAGSLSLDESGNLVIATPTGTLTDERPVAIQEKEGQQIEVESAFLIKDEDGQQSFGFVLGEGYDPQVPIVIDPGLVFSTFLGGSETDGGSFVDVAVDGEGSIYVTGITRSFDFPTTEGAFDQTFSDGEEGSFVTKLNATGSALVYSTYIGGTSRCIAVDFEGNAYVAGSTLNESFLTTEGAYDRTFNGPEDGFILKLNRQGSDIMYSTFLGGNYLDSITDIKIDSEGNAYVTGVTRSEDFPTTEGAYDRTYPGGIVNVFVTKLNAMGSGLVYSTFLGRSSIITEIIGMALDAAGNVYVTGSTDSADFPTTEGAYNRIYQGGEDDGFVTKLNATGSGLVYSTFLGGSDSDSLVGITVDFEGNAYVVGQTYSRDFPITEGAYKTTFSDNVSAFVTKLNATGSELVYSTFFGEYATGINSVAVDDGGSVYVTGGTNSADLPITDDAFQNTLRGTSDAFLAKLNATGSALLYSSYLGGSSTDGGSAITLDGAGSVYIVGGTASSDFPTTSGAFDETYNGRRDAFVTKWNLTPTPTGADVSVSVADMPDPVFVGTPLTYTIQVRNDGPETATGVRLTYILPYYVTFVSASSTQGDCSISGWVVTCEIGTMPSGETVTVSITVLPTRTGQLPSAACVTGNEGDPNPANNTVKITTTSIAKPPKEKILDEIGMVNTLVLVGSLTQVQANFLNSRLWAAIAQLDAGNVEGACSELCAFSQKVISYKNNGILPVQTANQLLRTAAAIRRQLGC